MKDFSPPFRWEWNLRRATHKEIKMKLNEMTAKLEELKTVTELTEEQKDEIQSLEKDIETETKAKTRFDELSGKDETQLTSEEVDELIQFEDKFAAEGKPAPVADTSKKYAGKYDTVEDLVKGIQSSKQEEERIVKEHPELVEELEGVYKDSQRSVTKLVKGVKRPPVRQPSSVPLDQRELNEMTQKEYDEWEKKDKLSSHSWLSNATRKESLKVESRKKVYAKYPQFYAMAQGVVTPDDKWQVFDKVATEHPEWIGEMNGPELCMTEMEKELNITPAPKVIKKPVILKPGFEQGKGSKGKSAKGVLSEEEFSKLSEDEQIAYMEGSVDKKG